MSSARTDGSSSLFDNLYGIDARENYSSAKVLTAAIEVTSLQKRQKDVTAKWNEYYRTRILKYVIEHRNGVENKVEGSVIVESLEPFP